MVCSDIWFNIILGVFVRVFLGEINIWISRQYKAGNSPQCGWASPNPLEAWIEQKCKVRKNSLSAWPSLSWEFGLLPLSWTWTGTYTISFPGLRSLLGFRSDLFYQLPPVSNLLTVVIGVLDLQNCESFACNKSLCLSIYLYLHRHIPYISVWCVCFPIGSIFLENSD